MEDGEILEDAQVVDQQQPQPQPQPQLREQYASTLVHPPWNSSWRTGLRPLSQPPRPQNGVAQQVPALQPDEYQHQYGYKYHQPSQNTQFQQVPNIDHAPLHTLESLRQPLPYFPTLPLHSPPELNGFSGSYHYASYPFLTPVQPPPPPFPPPPPPPPPPFPSPPSSPPLPPSETAFLPLHSGTRAHGHGNKPTHSAVHPFNSPSTESAPLPSPPPPPPLSLPPRESLNLSPTPPPPPPTVPLPSSQTPLQYLNNEHSELLSSSPPQQPHPIVQQVSHPSAYENSHSHGNEYSLAPALSSASYEYMGPPILPPSSPSLPHSLRIPSALIPSQQNQNQVINLTYEPDVAHASKVRWERSRPSSFVPSRGPIHEHVPVIVLDDEDCPDNRTATHPDASLSDMGDEVMIVPLAHTAVQNVNNAQQNDVTVELVEDSDTQSGPASQKALPSKINHFGDESHPLNGPLNPRPTLPHLDMRVLPPVLLHSVRVSAAPRIQDASQFRLQQTPSSASEPLPLHSPSDSHSLKKLHVGFAPPSASHSLEPPRRYSRSRFRSLTPPRTPPRSLVEPASRSPDLPRSGTPSLGTPRSNSLSVSPPRYVPSIVPLKSSVFPVSSSDPDSIPRLSTSEKLSRSPSPLSQPLPQSDLHRFPKPKKNLAELKKQILLSMKRPVVPSPASNSERFEFPKVDAKKRAPKSLGMLNIPSNTAPVTSFDHTFAQDASLHPNFDEKPSVVAGSVDERGNTRRDIKLPKTEPGHDNAEGPNLAPVDSSLSQKYPSSSPEILIVTLTESDDEKEPYSEYINRPPRKRNLSAIEQIEEMKIRVLHLGKCPSELYGDSPLLPGTKRRKAEHVCSVPSRDVCGSSVSNEEGDEVHVVSDSSPKLHFGLRPERAEFAKSSSDEIGAGEKIIKEKCPPWSSTSEIMKDSNRDTAQETNLVSGIKINLDDTMGTTSNQSKAEVKLTEPKQERRIAYPGSNPERPEPKQGNIIVSGGEPATKDIGKKKSFMKSTSSEIRDLKEKIAKLEKLREMAKIARERDSSNGNGKITRDMSFVKTDVVAGMKMNLNANALGNKKQASNAPANKKAIKQASGFGRARYYDNASGVRKFHDSHGIIHSASNSSLDSPERDVSAKWNETDPNLRGGQTCSKDAAGESGQLNDLKTELEMSKKELLMMQDYSAMMQRATISVAEAAAKVSFKRGRRESIEAELKKIQLEVQEAEQDYQKIVQAALAMRSSMKGAEDSDFSFPELEVISPTSFTQGKSNNSSNATGSNSEPKLDVVLRPSPFSPSRDDEVISPLCAFRSYALTHSIIHSKRVLPVPEGIGV